MINSKPENMPSEKKAKETYYSDYLQLETLLSCQKPISKETGNEAHDEHLFIIVHQVFAAKARNEQNLLVKILSRF